MQNDFFKGLVSPETRTLLLEKGAKLVSEDGKEEFTIRDGIACLLIPGNLNAEKKHEMKVFDNMKIQNISFFRNSLYDDVMVRISMLINGGSKSKERNIRVSEMGGGEGHWTRHVMRKFTNADVFVCDLSFNTLQRSLKPTKRICADATRPIFERGSIHVASFWVSLHHFGECSMREALNETVYSLSRSGILILFEPNSKFFLRKIMYRSRLSEDVYPDEKEQAVNFCDLSKAIESLGMVEVGTYFLNPPYNPDFVKKLKRWPIYMVAVEILYRLDKWILTPVFGSLFSNYQNRLKQYFTLYGLAIYKKKESLNHTGQNVTLLRSKKQLQE
jgi:uncharacterized protein YbaR (Trm112 family)|tara:strand:+ start:76 stop:1068 length:993 start_codon:yes stop_codon:yes gene_type:complete